MAESSSDDEQTSIEFENKGARSKDLVYKCNSDPGKVQVNKNLTIQTFRNSCAPRKCLLTLDGYSYVIGEIFDGITW
jgi:hypothetical protein